MYKDFNVILIVALSITNFVIECARPSSQLSPVFSFNFILLVISVFSFDAVEKKTRNFTLLLNFMFLAFVVIGLYDLAIGVLDVKTVLVDFGYGRVFYKRSVKRAIYVEIFFLLADARRCTAQPTTRRDEDVGVPRKRPVASEGSPRPSGLLV